MKYSILVRIEYEFVVDQDETDLDLDSQIDDHIKDRMADSKDFNFRDYIVIEKKELPAYANPSA